MSKWCAGTTKWRAALILAIGLMLPLSISAQDAFTTDLSIRELGSGATLRIQMFCTPGMMPSLPGEVALVKVFEASRTPAYFIPMDIAFELGDSVVYRVAFENSSDLFGQPMGGLVREQEVHFGFLAIPEEVGFAEALRADPEGVVLRYAHHRSGFKAADSEEVAAWGKEISRGAISAGMNAWWSWHQAVREVPNMTEGEVLLFAERLLPGRGHVLTQSQLSPHGIRNAILRVGERRLIRPSIRRRVAPAYPTAVRQAGIGGLVITLVYISDLGAVEDATVLATDTVHLLNHAALKAVGEWTFNPARDELGNSTDGWRVVPIEFRLGAGDPTAAQNIKPLPADETPAVVLYQAVPEYPSRAYRDRIEGTVVFRVVVDEKGRLREALLVEPVHPLLDEAAMHALERSFFSPALRGGEAVADTFNMSFIFPPETP